MFSGAKNDVISTVKKAAFSIQSGLGAESKGNAELGIAILNEKSVAGAFDKVAYTKSEALQSFVKWSEEEKCPIVKAFLLKMNDLGHIWITVLQEFSEQYDLHRKSYKEILKGEHTLDRMKKETEAQSLKVSKLNRQVEGASKTKKESLETALAKNIALHEKAEADLKYCMENHEKYKYLKIQEAMQTLSEGSLRYHTKGLKIVEAQKKLMTLFLGGSYQDENIPSEQLEKLKDEATSILHNLADELGQPRPETGEKYTRSELSKGDSSDEDDVPDYMALPRTEVKEADNLRQHSSNTEQLQHVAKGLQETATTRVNVYDNSLRNPDDDNVYEYVSMYDLNPRYKVCSMKSNSIYEATSERKEFTSLKRSQTEIQKLKPQRKAPSVPSIDSRKSKSLSIMPTPPPPEKFKSAPNSDGCEDLPPPPPELLKDVDEGEYMTLLPEYEDKPHP